MGCIRFPPEMYPSPPQLETKLIVEKFPLSTRPFHDDPTPEHLQKSNETNFTNPVSSPKPSTQGTHRQSKGATTAPKQKGKDPENQSPTLAYIISYACVYGTMDGEAWPDKDIDNETDFIFNLQIGTQSVL